MKTAQISIEFLFALGLVFLIFLTLLIFSLIQQGKYARISQEIIIKDECFKMANLITYTFLTGATTSTINHYSLTIVNTSRVLIINTTSCSIPLASVTSGTFSNHTIRFQKNAETVEVSNG